MMYSVAIPSQVHEKAVVHLIREDGQEDLCFALWHPSKGQSRTTALITRLLLPQAGERNVHGNVGFMPQYFERVLQEALKEGAGLAFMHSHPSSGWQAMSQDDVNAEVSHAAAVKAVTQLPLVGLTIGTDGAWSARFWEKKGPRQYERHWADSVRVVGEKLAITLHPDLSKIPVYRPELSRTISAWGTEVQTCLANLRVGIIGAGSVGSIVAESLARMGVGHIRLLDFDSVELVNLDRLLFARRWDAFMKRAKVEILAEALRQSATAGKFSVEPLEWSIVEENGYRAALDCDVLFSCVDRPLPRSVLNFIAYAHLIPVVDGGIAINVNERTHRLRHADWRAHAAMPTRPCLECLEQYDPGLVTAEREGYLDDPSYIKGLPRNHSIRRNENVFAFSLSVASFEVLQLLSLIVAPSGFSNPGAQRYRFVTSELERDTNRKCNPDCLYPNWIALGDKTPAPIEVTGQHVVAEKAREGRHKFRKTWRYKFYKLLADFGFKRWNSS